MLFFFIEVQHGGLFMKRLNGIFILFIFILFSDLASQQMPLPMKYQYQVLVKVLAYEGRLNSPDIKSINIGILYSNDKKSLDAKKDFWDTYNAVPVKALGQKAINVVEIKYTNLAQLENEIKTNKINVIYITPGMDPFLQELKSFASNQNLVTVTGVPEYVNNNFIMVGLSVKNKKPQIMVNLDLVKASGAKFSANFLRLCDVIRN